MALIEYRDRIRVSRPLRDEKGDAMYDEYDEPMTEKVYEGACSYQKGGQTSLSRKASNDQVYIPGLPAMMYIGDIVDVVTETGREVHGVVGNVRDIIMPLSRDSMTELEIKQATGD